MPASFPAFVGDRWPPAPTASSGGQNGQSPGLGAPGRASPGLSSFPSLPGDSIGLESCPSLSRHFVCLIRSLAFSAASLALRFLHCLRLLPLLPRTGLACVRDLAECLLPGQPRHLLGLLQPGQAASAGAGHPSSLPPAPDSSSLSAAGSLVDAVRCSQPL